MFENKILTKLSEVVIIPQSMIKGKLCRVHIILLSMIVIIPLRMIEGKLCRVLIIPISMIVIIPRGMIEGKLCGGPYNSTKHD